MPPGFLANFMIGETSFNRVTNPSIVGIYSSASGLAPDFINSVETKVRVRRSITLGSYLGDCTGFTLHDRAIEIIKEHHVEILQFYLKTIPQKQLFIFNDGSIYSSAMMQILLELSKNYFERITCFGVMPFNFEGKIALAMFNSSWDVIKDKADDTILMDISDYRDEIREVIESTEDLSPTDYKNVATRIILKEIAPLEDSFERVENPYFPDRI